MKQVVRRLLPLLDVALLPFVFPAAYLLKCVRGQIRSMPLAKQALLRVGVFPIRDHYYEPLFNPAHLREDLATPRALPGINWNNEQQLAFLSELAPYAAELADLAGIPGGTHGFDLRNENFASGDAEYWYCLLRKIKPQRIMEVGSGYSTLLARRAIERNNAEDPNYRCLHTCIEPYEMPWLEASGATVIRKRLEDMDVNSFRVLGQNDILFIDSSHVIRPQGDVVVEIVQILPLLQPGVIVHFHDVFSPRDYLHDWVVKDVRLWNEQYLLEAFLSQNNCWTVLGALTEVRHEVDNFAFFEA